MTGATGRPPSRAPAIEPVAGTGSRWRPLRPCCSPAPTWRPPHPAAPAATAGASWGRTVEVPGLAALNAGGNAQVLSVSCWRADYCAAGGFYTRKLGYQQAFVVLEHAGRGARPLEVPGSAALNAGGKAEVASVSCVSGGACTAGGFYTEHGKTTQGFVVTERGGRWSQGARGARPRSADAPWAGRAGRDRVVHARLLRGRRVLRRRGLRGDRARRPVGQRAGAARPGRAATPVTPPRSPPSRARPRATARPAGSTRPTCWTRTTRSRWKRSS